MKKIKIRVATQTRGFLLHLFKFLNTRFEFHWDATKVYETSSTKKLLIRKIVRSKIANYLGIIQRVKVRNQDFDLTFSYNRFLNVDKNYIICLENPTALYHYCLGRNETFAGKRRLRKLLNDPRLRSIVCISRACYNTISNFYDIPASVKIEHIYPYIPKNSFITSETIKAKCYRKELKCLYISSDFNLKGGMEILECFDKLNERKLENISLKIITRIDKLNKNIKEKISLMPNIELLDFKFSSNELSKIYSDSNILLNPSRQDSFSLVILEAMKAGNAILSTDLYAIPEMAEDGINGYLVSPRYRFYNYNNMPNKEVWNNRDKTIYSNYLDIKIIDFLFEKICFLYSRRNKLEEMSLNSFIKSNSGEFSDSYIEEKWAELIQSVV